MAIAASGTVSFSDLRTEFVGGSSAISLGDLYRGGSNILAKAGDNPSVNLAASVPTSGTIDIGDFHGTAKGFKSTISSTTTNLVANTLFGDDYDVNYPKIIDINSGVTIGGVSSEALTIPSGLAGGLTINNAGNIYGAGGVANGGDGRVAVYNQSSGVTINNTGEIRGGGGGGGQKEGFFLLPPTGNIYVQVGSGGAGGSNYNPGQNGNPSYCGPWPTNSQLILANGGGAGQGYGGFSPPTSYSRNNGSGGGALGTNQTTVLPGRFGEGFLEDQVLVIQMH